MPAIQRDDIRIHYEVLGSGAPIVLAHSFLCSGCMWAPQLEPLSGKYQVINIDLRGHGKSTPVDRRYSLYDLVEDVVAVLDEINIGSAVWAGLSIGGMIALRAALTVQNRVAGLILLDTHAGAETTLNKLKYTAMATAARVVGTAPLAPQVARLFFSPHTRQADPELVKKWQANFASVPLVTVLRTLQALKTRDSVVPDLNRIRIPALVMVGEDDQPLPPPYSREIAKGLPHSSLVEIKRCGHLATLDQPQEVTSAMLSFLEKI